MPVRPKPLTNTEIKNAKPKSKEYKLADGEGLKLRVRPNGSKTWLLDYYRPFTKKRSTLGLGKYPDISLAQAREKRTQIKSLLAQNIDPKQEKERVIAESKLELEGTFYKVACNWFEVKKTNISADYADDVWRSFENYLFPAFKNIIVKNISAQQVIEVLRPIEAKGSLETVKRLCQRINEIIDYAINTGLLEANPIARINKAFKKPVKVNMPSISASELPAFLEALHEANIKKVTRNLILWQLHTMVRPSEAAGARWEEIDWENELWIIPAERMKKKREHIVPLTPETLSILKKLKPISSHREHLFPADRNPRTHCNNQTANAAIKRMGYSGKLVSHGLRSLASTTLNDEGFPPYIVEAALSHQKDSEVEAAYNRAKYMKQRTLMMNYWSEKIHNLIQKIG